MTSEGTPYLIRKYGGHSQAPDPRQGRGDLREERREGTY
jgi:hypothetical protein